MICLPTVWTGFRAVSGSWKIMAISSPRTIRIRPSSASSSSVPRHWIDPVIVACGFGQQPQHAHGGHGLAGPRLADHGQTSPGATLEVDAPHGVDRAVVGAEVDA